MIPLVVGCVVVVLLVAVTAGFWSAVLTASAVLVVCAARWNPPDDG